MKLKILFFAPHSAIWVHAFPEALAAEALKQVGHEVLYVTCGKEFRNYCVAMSAYNLTPEAPIEQKNRICSLCNKHKEIIKEQFKFNGYDLSSKLTEFERAEVKHILNTTRRDKFLDLTIDGVNIGRISLYEFLLQHKKINLSFSEIEWNRFLIGLENVLYSFFACRKILDEEKPDRIIVYNSLYSVNHVCHKLGEIRKIPHYFLHAGGNLSNRLQTLVIGKGHTAGFYRDIIGRWSDYKERPCSRKELSGVSDHLMELFKGKNIFAYSSEKRGDSINIRKKFGIESNQKIIVAVMSSYDERFAAESVGAVPSNYELCFPTQSDWLNALINFFRYRSDCFLIIRVHPREFPNKRESSISEHAKTIEEIFKNLPSNVKVNWPNDQISLYDLAEETSVFLNAWSSAGKEMSLFGLPVVLYSKDLTSYPSELNYVGENRENYFKKINIALENGWSFENIRQSYRWYVLEFGHSVINISDSYAKKETDDSVLLIKMFKRLRRRMSPYYLEKNDCQRRNPTLKERDLIVQVIEQGKNTVLDLFEERYCENVTKEQETSYIKDEMKKLITIMYPNNLPSNNINSLRKKLTMAVSN